MMILFLTKYWRELTIVILVGFVAFGYWLNVQTSKELGKTEIQLELEQLQNEKIRKGQNAISKPSSPSNSDASDVLRKWELRQSD